MTSPKPIGWIPVSVVASPTFCTPIKMFCSWKHSFPNLIYNIARGPTVVLKMSLLKTTVVILAWVNCSFPYFFICLSTIFLNKIPGTYNTIRILLLSSIYVFKKSYHYPHVLPAMLWRTLVLCDKSNKVCCLLVSDMFAHPGYDGNSVLHAHNGNGKKF